jgi:large subunit ribosomal protein L24
MKVNNRKSRLRVGDTVIVTSGAHKGSTGEVTRFSKDRTRVFVEGVNMVKRHEKPQAALGRAGGIVEKEASIHVSNVALQTAEGAATRVGFKFLDNGEKVRFAKKTGEQI